MLLVSVAAAAFSLSGGAALPAITVENVALGAGRACHPEASKNPGCFQERAAEQQRTTASAAPAVAFNAPATKVRVCHPDPTKDFGCMQARAQEQAQVRAEAVALKSGAADQAGR